MSWISGTGLTAFGRLEGSNTLQLMSTAATSALAEAGMERKDIGGLICGYSTTFPHLMLSTVFAEHFGIRPGYAHSLQLGGGTGLAMVMLAHYLVDAGIAHNILVVAGENRLTGQSRDTSMQTLAQVGHPAYEVPLGATIPAYYALLASQYMNRFGVGVEDLAELAVLMRRQAQHHPGAQFRSPITVEDVLQSRQIASPLKILDCCPVSDGGAAFIITRTPTHPKSIRIAGCGQAHLHQHVSTIADISSVGGAISANRALDAAKRHLSDINYVAIYDSFTITLTMLLEEIGFASRGKAGSLARDGYFDRDGRLPLNTHGGLLSYGHCGVGGAMAHLAEACAQMTGRAEARQVRDASVALVHADGGVLSSHVSMVLEQS
jgi:acetyl-CoA acetyltransferase